MQPINWEFPPHSAARCYISCFDGAHQAISWNEEERKPEILEDKCVGCQLCLLVCPVWDCITPGKILFKDQSQMGKGSKSVFTEEAPNARKLKVGEYNRP